MRMTFKSRFVAEMNKIKGNEEFKTELIRNVLLKQDQPTVRKLPAKVFMLVASIAVIFIISELAPSKLLENRNLHNVQFSITAYAAEGLPISVKPNIEFPLGQYSLMSSNVPGFPVTINCKEATRIVLRSTNGKILLWNKLNWMVSSKGKEASIESGTTIYWTPIEEGMRAKETTLELIAYKGDSKIADSLIKIKTDNNLSYNGTLIEK
jgi:hypothetical protein